MLFLSIVHQGGAGLCRRQPLQFLFSRAQLGIDRHAFVELLLPPQPRLDPLDLARLALDRFGLMVQATQHRNAIQTDALLGAVYHANTDVWTVKADNWNVTTFMAGPYITVPKGRFSVDGHLVAGWAQATMPNTAMAGTIGTTTMSVQTTGSQTGGLALGAGASLRYRLCPDLSANLNADYSYSQLTFNNLTSRAVSSNGVSESLPYSSDRQIGLVSISVGLAFLFGNSNRPF